MSNVPNPKIGHLFMGGIIDSSHLRNNLFDEFKHPLNEAIGLCVCILRQPNVLLLVAGHHEHDFLLHNFPHSPL